jgi:ketosteroid isomerase-like protein
VSQDEDVVRRIYEAWNRREDPIALGLLAGDVEYVSPPDAMEPGTRSGHEGWRRAMSMIFDSYDDVRFDVQRILEAGGRVVVLAVMRIRGRESGVEMETRQGYVWTVRDGRATRLEWYTDYGQALAAAGIDPAGAGSG